MKSGETKWVDVTAVHTGAESYQDKELKSLTARQISSQVSESLVIPDPFKSDPSPLLIERTSAKISKYSRLVLVAKKQAAGKKRKQVPLRDVGLWRACADGSGSNGMAGATVPSQVRAGW